MHASIHCEVFAAVWYIIPKKLDGVSYIIRKNPPTLKSSGYSETWLRTGDAEA
jgi:hypothetical protein